MRFALAAMMLCAMVHGAGADDVKAPETPQSASPETPAAPPPEAVIAFGVSHPACEEWTDGCVICTRSADALNCSTPGVACQPGPTICRRETPQDVK
jgi:hypothetical protein